MNTHDKIVKCRSCGYVGPCNPTCCEHPDYDGATAEEAWQAAIEADRKRRGEPVACPICSEDEAHTGTCGSNDPRALCKALDIEGFCLHEAHREHKHKTGEDCTCPKYIRHPSCVQHEVRKYLPSKNPWGVAPQPAEPVKVPSDAESWLEEAIEEVVIAALEEGMCGRAMGDTPLTDSAKAGAMQRIRALLARYGKGTP